MSRVYSDQSRAQLSAAGTKGGLARAAKLSSERRAAIGAMAGTASGRSRRGEAGGIARWATLSPEDRERQHSAALQRARDVLAIKRANLAKGRARQAELRANPLVTTLRAASPLPVSPAVALYRDERDRRAPRNAQLIEDAKAMYGRLYGGSLGAAGERERY
jgi:hypothetical protein